MSDENVVYEPAGAMVPDKASGMAKAAMFLGLAPWVCCCGTSVVMGVVAMISGAGTDPKALMAKVMGYQVINLIFTCIFLIMAALGVVLGFMAKSRINHSGGALKGKGMAWMAIIAGGLYIVIAVILVIVGFVFRFVGNAALSNFGST